MDTSWESKLLEGAPQGVRSVVSIINAFANLLNCGSKCFNAIESVMDKYYSYKMVGSPTMQGVYLDDASCYEEVKAEPELSVN